MKLGRRRGPWLVASLFLAPVLAAAHGGCGGEKVAIGGDHLAGSGKDGGTGEVCGPTTCAAGQVCCNASCGVCTEPGGACDLMACVDPCAAQDAAGVGACDMALGYKWDGNACVLVGGCSCEGTDCAALFGTPDECTAAHAECRSTSGCTAEQQAVLDFIGANKACATAADCETQQVGCGITEDGCTGAVYVNQSIDSSAWASLVGDFTSCMGSAPACATCDRMTQPAACIAGRCQRAGSCSGEANALLEFIAANKACSSAADCQTQYVGCDITEDDCTGAVYVNDSTDLGALESLRREYYMCTTGTEQGCAVCLRISREPVCVAGRCQ